jgi:hypothetical protein
VGAPVEVERGDGRAERLRFEVGLVALAFVLTLCAPRRLSIGQQVARIRAGATEGIGGKDRQRSGHITKQRNSCRADC